MVEFSIECDLGVGVSVVLIQAALHLMFEAFAVVACCFAPSLSSVGYLCVLWCFLKREWSGFGIFGLSHLVADWTEHVELHAESFGHSAAYLVYV